MYPRMLSLVFAAVIAASAPVGGARAQTADAIEALLNHEPESQASREDRADAPSEPVSAEALVDASAPLAGLAGASRTQPGSLGPDAICRVMTDMAQRSRRERVCMPRAGWDALIRVAKGPGFRTSSAGRLKVAYRGRRD